ncbi:MAG: nucleoside-diphosphate kinase [SAR86 cluster bacterium]|nr:nucleoside-diphosphate kinase [SAR86 cluster bacterium]
MSIQKTLSIIKPDAISKGYRDDICKRIESNGLNIIEKKEILLTQEQAEGFYAEHKERSFFVDLIKFMTSGPVQVQILEGEEAISNYRELMGNTNPKEAAIGSIRAEFADSIDANAVHGSDSEVSAAREVEYFFPNS